LIFLGLELLTGCPCHTIDLQHNFNKIETWSVLKDLLSDELLAVASCGNRDDKINDENDKSLKIYEALNLFSGHAYSFLYVIELKDLKLIQLRNP
jgi:hypothetical protein